MEAAHAQILHNNGGLRLAFDAMGGQFRDEELTP